MYLCKEFFLEEKDKKQLNATMQRQQEAVIRVAVAFAVAVAVAVCKEGKYIEFGCYASISYTFILQRQGSEVDFALEQKTKESKEKRRITRFRSNPS